MKQTKLKGHLILAATILVAMILSILPLPKLAQWLSPHWVVLVMIYWAIALPFRVNVGVAFIVGILLDVLNGTLIGEHALALVIITYFAVKFHTQIRVFPVLQQALIVCGLILIYQACLSWVQSIISQPLGTWWVWLAAFSSMLLWPWTFNLLRDCRRRFRIE